MTRSWDDVVPPEDRAAIQASGMGRSGGFGTRPAILVVDITYDFTGDRDEPLQDSIARFPLSCGPAAWRAIPIIRDFLRTARQAGVPVIYTRQAPRRDVLTAGSWASKNSRVLETTPESQEIGSEIPKEIAPRLGELLLEKDKPSAFFGTPLISLLNSLAVDSLIIMGTSTSGCVRATVVDAFSLNYSTVVLEDCVFDRSLISHKVALFDMNAKYADVLLAAEATPLLPDPNRTL